MPSVAETASDCHRVLNPIFLSGRVLLERLKKENRPGNTEKWLCGRTRQAVRLRVLTHKLNILYDTANDTLPVANK